MPTALIPSKYDKLISDLSAILEKGKRLAEAQELADPNQENAFMSRLSEDLKIDLPLLYRIKQFFKLWSDEVPVLEGHPTLSWSHFVEILSIKDPKEKETRQPLFPHSIQPQCEKTESEKERSLKMPRPNPDLRHTFTVDASYNAEEKFWK